MHVQVHPAWKLISWNELGGKELCDETYDRHDFLRVLVFRSVVDFIPAFHKEGKLRPDDCSLASDDKLRQAVDLSSKPTSRINISQAQRMICIASCDGPGISWLHFRPASTWRTSVPGYW